MKAYLAIKFYEDFSNKELIDQISNSLKKIGVETRVIVRDHEKWGKVKFTAKALMDLTFKEIDSCDILIIEFSEKGVGLGIEAGYSYAKEKPIIIIAKTGSHVSNTLKGIANTVIFYDKIFELEEKIKRFLE